MVSTSAPSLEYGLKPRRGWKRLILKVSLILGGIGVILVGVADFLLSDFFGENRFTTNAANAVVAQVMNHTLIPNAAGIVTLPASQAAMSEDGKVYVTVDSAGTTWILFPTWRGKGDNITAYLYHSSSTDRPPPAQITVIGPGLMPPFAGSLPYTVDRQVDANWYHISWSMD